MKNKYGITEENYQAMMRIFREIPEINTVILFGSRARGNYKKTSDIDLAVTFEKGDKKLQLIRKLEEMKCILKFDVLNLEKVANEKLLQNIQKEGICLYKKDN